MPIKINPNHLSDKTTFSEDDVFKILSQELDDSEPYSSPIDNSLAKMVTKIWNSRLSNDKLKAKKNKFLRPKNIEALCVKKME